MVRFLLHQVLGGSVALYWIEKIRGIDVVVVRDVIEVEAWKGRVEVERGIEEIRMTDVVVLDVIEVEE